MSHAVAVKLGNFSLLIIKDLSGVQLPESPPTPCDAGRVSRLKPDKNLSRSLFRDLLVQEVAMDYGVTVL